MAGGLVRQQFVTSNVHIGQVGDEGNNIVVTPTISTSAYTANDQIGGVMTFSNAGRIINGSGIITDMLLIDEDAEDANIELWLFSQNPSSSDAGDNVAFAPSNTDLPFLMAVIEILNADYFDGNSKSVAQTELTKRFECTSDQNALFGIAVIREAKTYTSTSDLTFILKVLQD